MTPSDTQATFCATLLDEWCRAGVTHAVVCPGSRSTPMALAIAEDPRLKLEVILDERSASFFAIGLARATGQPALLLCTSGTAAVEFHPAVVEAHLDGVPMIVVTADRPPELHGIGAPQTVDQNHLYGRSVRAFFDPGVADQATSSTWRSVASRALLAATGGRNAPGPVHVNLAFREPLVGVPRRLPPARADGRPWHESANSSGAVSAEAGSAVASMGSIPCAAVHPRISGKPGVIVAGAKCGEPGAVQQLAAALGWPVIADPRSGVRAEMATDPAPALTVVHADAILRSPVLARSLRPEVVVRVGAPHSSKVLNGWLATISTDILVDPHGIWLDPNRASAVNVAMDPTELCRALASAVEPTGAAWLARWSAADRAARQVLADRLDAPGTAVSEPAIARILVRSVPDGSQVVVSSSMPMRDIEWFGGVTGAVTFHANRGANGIDGVVSTALGIAASGKGPTFALVGDLAFLHDAGALAVAARLDASCTFVVVDNSGGGIFEFLPQATSVERKRFEALYGTPQNVDIVKLGRAHGIAALAVTSLPDLRRAIRRFAEKRGTTILVVKTDRRQNVVVHDGLNAAVVQAAEAAVAAISASLRGSLAKDGRRPPGGPEA